MIHSFWHFVSTLSRGIIQCDSKVVKTILEYFGVLFAKSILVSLDVGPCSWHSKGAMLFLLLAIFSLALATTEFLRDSNNK